MRGSSRQWQIVLVMLATAGSTQLLAEPADAIDRALDKVGLSKSDLGWRAKAWWLRYPRDTFHKLDLIDDLLADPLATVPFTRSLGRGAEQLLDPAQIGKDDSVSSMTAVGGGSRGITRFAHLAIDNRYAGIRLTPLRLSQDDIALDEAILQSYRDHGYRTQFYTVNQARPFPDTGAELKRKLSSLSPELSRILGRLLTNVMAAHEWAESAFRDVPAERRIQARRRLDLGLDLAVGDDYPSVRVFDDISRAWDEPSLWYAALICVEALDRARSELRALRSTQLKVDDFDWQTPLGWVRIRGSGPSRIDADDTLLAVDLGGDDVWSGEVAASSPSRPIGLALDLAGNDRYESAGYAQGAGVVGIGVLLDAQGNDHYGSSGPYSQGVAQLGFGALIDLAGDDVYKGTYSAQASAPFAGVAVLVDAAGRDRYEIIANGQAYAGPGSVAVLAERDGNDSYTAEKDGKISGQMSYGMAANTMRGSRGSTSLVQGVGAGLAQAHVTSRIWAGGLGALLDVAGNDRYSGGNWSQGTGYFFGTGLLYDGQGNDTYDGEGIRSQASAVHFAVGALVDEGGNDHHINGNLAFAADFSVAIFASHGGNDVYDFGTVGDSSGPAVSSRRSVAIFNDDRGDDVYHGPPTLKPGTTHGSGGSGAGGKVIGPFDGLAIGPFYDHVPSIALFVDANGNDEYSAGLDDNTEWISSSDPAKKEFAVGVDAEDSPVEWRAYRP